MKKIFGRLNEKVFQKIWFFAKRRKFLSAVITVAIIGGGYWLFFSGDTAAETRYFVTEVKKGDISVTINGTGQVSAVDEVEVKPKASGDVTYVAVKEGQFVYAGALITELDTTDAQKTVRDAEISLRQAEVELDRLVGYKTADGSIRGNKEKAQDDLEKSYEDGFNSVSAVFLQLPNIMTGLYDIIYGFGVNSSQTNLSYYTDAVKDYDDRVLIYKENLSVLYTAAKKSYDANLDKYKSASRLSSNTTIENLIDQTYNTVRDVAETVKSANNLIQFYQDEMTERGVKPITLSTTHLSSLSSYTDKTNSFLSSLLSIRNSIQSNKESVAGADFDVEDQKIKVDKLKAELETAKSDLNNYYIRAPFSGVIAELNVRRLDSVSSGTVIATVITTEKQAEISLNEIDAAKIKVGQKAKLSFDAIEGLEINGEVRAVDLIGAVSQGVVSYGVVIGFDAKDDQIKSGMTTSADIITETKTGVLTVPSTAIKTMGDRSYVEILSGTYQINERSGMSGGIVTTIAPSRKFVEVGLSNDDQTEILSGLEEGEQIIARTVASLASTQTNSTPSLFQAAGGNRSIQTGGVRMIR